ncbi:YkgJ family cysteine cluster protein [cf. Phormidesmis sp. LEGE 11477]|uniref:YkgJ family cysteine cluster protein n=1 Tax=cf. Phormidesmis sp. LEGE 11477 TaxID=1828680 RepID=UPI001881327E|nr:YkgJ family cysteine cluster protein [cf. Phormidesmis sp. LEGE 11477]MBE9063329.1 YkgJ family cysteine cluster protein [cf. Phormidesmis sp. LEGE 11477]
MATWQCVKNCGACCELSPADRPDLADYLTPTQLSLYMSMVGEDGWCIHYNKDQRRCTIYEERPSFCRVQADTFRQLYSIEPNELNDFAIECCEQQIDSIYGNMSPEMDRFYQAIGVDTQVIKLESRADVSDE